MLLQIIKKSLFLLCTGTILIFTSCNGEETKSLDAEDTATESVNDTPRSQPNLNGSESQVIDETTVNNNENESSENIPTNVGSQEVTNLNPPHGEPGHDCAVPVGKPLPSSSSANSPMNNTVVLNPPHGEPGHDCAVAVGDPLN